MQSSNLAELLSAREAAERLGIKLDTLYAYVSRGMLGSVTVPGSRERRYRAEDVERFRSSRGERGGPAEALMPVIGSSICLIEDGRLYYRGHDAVRLAETATLEDVADLLWGGEAPHPALHRKRGREDRHGGKRPVHARLSLGLIERCQVRLAALAADDLAALDLSRAGVIRTGQAILSALIVAVGDGGASSQPGPRPPAAVLGLGDTRAHLPPPGLVLLAPHAPNAPSLLPPRV